ncbi:hypothetical protein DFJ73DRAFT_898339 [Zopfochytrium polystomum]|nr:hypothetical protein DFJ73DRAFT_898339 [Zopfochytrium polystomum]
MNQQSSKKKRTSTGTFQEVSFIPEYDDGVWLNPLRPILVGQSRLDHEMFLKGLRQEHLRRTRPTDDQISDAAERGRKRQAALRRAEAAQQEQLSRAEAGWQRDPYVFDEQFGFAPLSNSQPVDAPPSTHRETYLKRQQREQKDFEEASMGILKNYVLWQYPSIESAEAVCGFGDCIERGRASCSTCRMSGMNGWLCEEHIRVHQSSMVCHMISTKDRPNKFLACCGHDSRHMAFESTLYGIQTKETVLVPSCTHGPTHILTKLGFMPSTIRQPASAFSFKLLRIAKHLTLLGASAQSVATALIWQCDDEMFPSYYILRNTAGSPKVSWTVSVMDGMSALVLLSTSQMTGLAHQKTRCSARFSMLTFIPSSWKAGDGYFSASHLRYTKGGGGAAVKYPHCVEYFQPLISSIPNASKADSECKATFFAADHRIGYDKKNDVNGIFGTSCAHGVVTAVLDIDRGEGFKYMDSAVKHLVTAYGIPESKLILCYDIVCRYLQHCLKHSLPKPLICMLPCMHAYCHDAPCQNGFAPFCLLGVGTKDGEWSERNWSDLGPSIGTTQRATLGYRQLVITDVLDHQSLKHISMFVRNTSKLIQKALDARVNQASFFRGVGQANRVERMKQQNASSLGGSDLSKTEKLAALMQGMMALAVKVNRMEANLKRRDGSSGGTYEATQLKKSLKKSMERMKALVATYNEIQHSSESSFSLKASLSEEASDNDSSDEGSDEEDAEKIFQLDSLDSTAHSAVASDTVAPQLLARDVFAKVKASPPKDDSHDVFWRRIEDLYHGKADLERCLVYFDWRVNSYWPAIAQTLESTGEMEPEWRESASRLFLHLTHRDESLRSQAESELRLFAQQPELNEALHASETVGRPILTKVPCWKSALFGNILVPGIFSAHWPFVFIHGPQATRANGLCVGANRVICHGRTFVKKHIRENEQFPQRKCTFGVKELLCLAPFPPTFKNSALPCIKAKIAFTMFEHTSRLAGLFVISLDALARQDVSLRSAARPRVVKDKHLLDQLKNEFRIDPSLTPQQLLLKKPHLFEQIGSTKEQILKSLSNLKSRLSKKSDNPEQLSGETETKTSDSGDDSVEAGHCKQSAPPVQLSHAPSTSTLPSKSSPSDQSHDVENSQRRFSEINSASPSNSAPDERAVQH